jgi:mono/diheme cytochrome c family protein
MSTVGKRIIKILGWGVGIVVVLLFVLAAYIQISWDAKDDRPAPNLKAPADSTAIARGKYIFKFQAQCWGCHQSPSQPGIASAAGGMLFDLSDTGPGFGKWYSRNLTPDMETGLGRWTDGEIVQALREGLNKDRITLFPIMPADWYHGMADDDVLAVVAYLRSLPPVKNKVPQSEPSFVAKALFTFKLMKPKDQIAAPVVAPPRGITAEYGRYLSNNLSGCADCHTPRNLQDGKFYLDSLFAGSSFAFEGNILSYARNITPDVETGIGSWSEDQFIDAVTSGVRPDGSVLTPHMPYAYYKSWSMDDLRAVFTYLKTVPARRRTVPANEFDSHLKTAQGSERGKLLFGSRCQACHGENGGGAQPTNVKLAEVAASLNDNELKEFIGSGQMNLKMPAFGKTLNGDELTDLVAFIRTWEKK